MKVRAKLSHHILAVSVVAACVAGANFDAISDSYKIRSISRPCCGFVPSMMTKLMGIAGFADPAALGTHDFGRLVKSKEVAPYAGYQPEAVGQVFTCRAGFVDISHLRDNADWAATVYKNIQKKIGTGASLPIGKEGGVTKATLELPLLTPSQLASLSQRDISDIAIALTFDIALFHEVATYFPIAVSAPRVPLLTERVITEKSSSFSVEDGYSNLLGAYLGRDAADSPLPYNQAMTEILSDTLQKLGAQSEENSKAVFQSLKGQWWKGGLFKNYKQVRRRSFEFEGEVIPRLPATEKAVKLCGEPNGEPLKVPSVAEISGLKHTDVAYVRIIPSRQYARKLRKFGVELNQDGSLTRDQFSFLIPKIRAKMLMAIPAAQTY